MKILFLINPHSGKKRGLRYAQAAASALTQRGHKCLLVVGDSIEDAEESFQRGLSDFLPEIVVAVGGDGAVHMAIQRLANTNIPLAIIPAGTGNDFARTHAFSALDLDLDSRPRVSIDLGLISAGNKTEWFGQVLSTGFDSLVNRRANNFPFIRGRIKYTIATLCEIIQFKAIQYQLKIDGVERETGAMLVAVANGPSYGGGMQIVPSADYRDGELDLLILKPVSKLELLKVFPKVFSGAHVSHPAVEIHRAKSVFLSATTLAYADGEFIDQLPIRVEVIPNALQLVDMR